MRRHAEGIKQPTSGALKDCASPARRRARMVRRAGTSPTAPVRPEMLNKIKLWSSNKIDTGRPFVYRRSGSPSQQPAIMCLVEKGVRRHPTRTDARPACLVVSSLLN